MPMLPNDSKKLHLFWATESIALAKPFKISRGTKTHAEVVVLTIRLDGAKGWAEAVPYARYNESIASTNAILEKVKASFLAFEDLPSFALIAYAQAFVNENLPASSAKNLLDSALWDLKAGITHTSVNCLINLPEVTHAVSAQTLSVDSIDIMVANAKTMAHLPLIKIKLDSADIVAKMQAIHKACPNSKFIIDANEAWSFAALHDVVNPLANLNVAVIEQPLPAGEDDELIGFSSPIPLCADESCHTSANISLLATKYSMVNIKLDKTGGLSEALALTKAAKTLNLQIMLGCMVASSLAMAPIFVLAQYANFIDLDGPVLVAKDRDNGFEFSGAVMHKPINFLWGQG